MKVLRIYSTITHVPVIFLITILSTATSKGRDDVFCSCHKREIKCKDVHDIDILEVHYSSVKNCSATELRISNSHLLALPNKMLNGTNITEIRIDSTYLPFLAVPIGDENPFLGGDMVVKFTVEMVDYPYNWKWNILNACKNLQKLHISKSDMIYVGPTFKKLNLQFLAHLSIQKSRVRWIHDKAFKSLKKLAFLNFQNNDVKRFKRSILPDPALYLTVINFRRNLLEYLEDDFFDSMPMLTYVNLEYNNLATLSEFKNMNKRFFINLAGNPLICDCSIEWLNKFTDQTDSYRLRCIPPDVNGSSILVKKVDWSEYEC